MISIHTPRQVLHLTKTFSCITLLFLLSCGQEVKEAPRKEHIEETFAVSEKPKSRILVFGNSLTAGYGLSPDKAYPALLQQKIDSLQLPFRIVNAGLSGDTSEGGLNRLEWVLQQPVEVFILELGANDGLRGLPPSTTRNNLESIIERVHKKDSTIPIILAGMKIPPNLGQSYSWEFERNYQTLAKRQGVYLVPFLLEGVAGKPELNLADGIHPNARGHQVLAENVWKVLYPVLKKKFAPRE